MRYPICGLAVFCLAVITNLAGCRNINPVLDTAGSIFAGSFGNTKPNYVEGFEYLELEWQGHKAALALGYRDELPNEVKEYWYSGQGELLVLKNGRVVQALGMTQELRSVTSAPPAWADLLAHRSPKIWEQSKDLLPSYRYGLQEFVISQQVTPTKIEKLLVDSEALWVLEEVKTKRDDGRIEVYGQKFAIRDGRVIYSEQCLTPVMCFKLRPLGVVVRK